MNDHCLPVITLQSTTPRPGRPSNGGGCGGGGGGGDCANAIGGGLGLCVLGWVGSLPTINDPTVQPTSAAAVLKPCGVSPKS